jgi:hypothetical protein
MLQNGHTIMKRNQDKGKTQTTVGRCERPGVHMEWEH